MAHTGVSIKVGLNGYGDRKTVDHRWCEAGRFLQLGKSGAMHEVMELWPKKPEGLLSSVEFMFYFFVAIIAKMT